MTQINVFFGVLEACDVSTSDGRHYRTYKYLPLLQTSIDFVNYFLTPLAVHTFRLDSYRLERQYAMLSLSATIAIVFGILGLLVGVLGVYLPWRHSASQRLRTSTPPLFWQCSSSVPSSLCDEIRARKATFFLFQSRCDLSFFSLNIFHRYGDA